MKNKDIHEWLLDEGINPLTTVTTEKGEYYLSDILEKHLTEQLRLFVVSGQSEQFCSCSFVMIIRDVNTDVPFCAECGKEVNEQN